MLVPGVLDGELVSVDRIERRGRVTRGRLVELIEASPDRVEPACPLLARCGGCPWMRLGREAQRGAIVGLVKAGIARVPGAADVDVEVFSEGSGLDYRRRARLAFRGGRLGYRVRRSHEIVDVSSCLVLRPELSIGLSALRSELLPRLVGEGDVQLAIGAGGRAVSRVNASEAQAPETYHALQRLVDEGTLAGAALAVADSASPATWGDPREDAPGVDGERLLGTVGGFSQANEAINRALVQWVGERARPEGQRILELYAGHGNLTIALARGAKSIAAVEIDRAAAAACSANLKARGLKGRVLTGDAGALGAWSQKKVDVVVLDPPRSGAREAIAGILATAPGRIVYVSCDTSTFGRDLSLLGEGGYRLVELAAFDMFPHTGHVETAALLEPT